MLVEYEQGGAVLSVLPLWKGMHDLESSIGQAKGVAIGPQGDIFIVSEPNLFYRFSCEDRPPRPAASSVLPPLPPPPEDRRHHPARRTARHAHHRAAARLPAIAVQLVRATRPAHRRPPVLTENPPLQQTSDTRIPPEGSRSPKRQTSRLHHSFQKSRDAQRCHDALDRASR